MEWLVLIALGAWIYAMQDRIKRLEKRLEDALWRAAEAQTQPAASQATYTVPLAASAPQAMAQPVQAPKAETEPAAQSAPPEPERVAHPENASAETTDPTIGAPNHAFPKLEIPKFDFEDIFGRRLPIWAGGIALAVAGVFLVIYSVENGLLTPPVRVALSFVFGAGLLGVAEAAHRFEKWVDDPRVRQALAGAGLATLYAAFYLAGALYGLIGPGLAFAGLAGVTALAIGLTFRFGLPAAVLGLVGGFATPLLVASQSANVPVLTFYLALLTAGLALTGRRIGQPWLGAAALAAGFGWGAVLLAGQLAGQLDVASAGLYLIALGVGVPLLAVGQGQWSLPRVGAGAVAVLQLAFLVDLAGYDALTWGLFLLLAAGLAALAWREEALRPGNALVAALGALLLAIWPDPEAPRFAMTAAAFAAIALGMPLALVWRERASMADLLQLTLTPPAIAAAAGIQFAIDDGDEFQLMLAIAFAALAAFPSLAAWRLWRGDDLARWLPLPVGIAALLGFGALHLILPGWAEVIGASAIALLLCALAWKRRDAGLEPLAWAGAAITLISLLGDDQALYELSRLIGEPYGQRELVQGLIRWTAASLPLAALAWLHSSRASARIAEGLLAFTFYGLAAQLIPGDWLAWTTAILALTCLWQQSARTGFWGTMAGFAGLWALAVFGQWAAPGVEALAGRPMLAGALPASRENLRLLWPIIAVFGFAAWTMRGHGRRAEIIGLAAGGLTMVTAHLLYKQVFSLVTYEGFVSLGMAERTIWQALLLAAGLGLARLGPTAQTRKGGALLATLALAHFVWFTLLLHNPLWGEQAVGPWPLANWLLAAYGIAGLAIVWLARQTPENLKSKLCIIADVAVMGLIAMFALSSLRHAFSGSVIGAATMSQSEDLLRSLLGIMLALGFLWWGSRTGRRSWRIGSLGVMLAAVLKVFLVDAAGLEGLLRIASFLALGFSLIGIGWVYSRQLKSGRADELAVEPRPAPPPPLPR